MASRVGAGQREWWAGWVMDRVSSGQGEWWAG